MLLGLIAGLTFSLAAVPTATAAPPDSTRDFVPAGPTVSMELDCSSVPDTHQAKAALRRYHLCGEGTGDVTSMSTVASNCGTLSLTVTNRGGGLMQWNGQIVSTLGPFTSASYSGSWSNITKGRQGPVSRSRFGFTSDWLDSFAIGTGPGSVFGIIGAAAVQLWWGPWCVSSIPVDSHTTVT
jgi:hypothetical protein